MSETILPTPSVKPPRRVRYRGKHPRHFHEKYKELNPEKYPETVERVLASGKTPAGMHRPICVEQILDVLNPKPGENGIDCTLGYGGHALELVKRIEPGGKLIAIDTDPIEGPRTVQRLLDVGVSREALSFHCTNFAALPVVLAADGISTVDFLLADLGISSMQLDDPVRGFSYKVDGPLDLRMNPSKGSPASALLNQIDKVSLETLLRVNSDEPHAARLAAAICEGRARSPILRTKDLRETLARALTRLPRALQQAEGDKPIRRVFQALRIQVNDEFGALDNLLRVLPGCLAPGGRAAILTFHSGEDRRVKQSFATGKASGVYSSISDVVIRPDPAEVRANPRASSAKLRWAVRTG